MSNEPLNILNLNSPEEEKVSFTTPEDLGTRHTEEGIREKTSEALMADPSLNKDEVSYLYANGMDKEVDNLVGAKRDEKRNEALGNFVNEMVANGSPEALEMIKGAFAASTDPELTSYDGAVSKEYAKAVAANIALESLTINEVKEDDPELAMRSLDVVEEFGTKASIVRGVYDTWAKKFQDKSLLGKAWDIAPLLVPFSTWIARNDAVKNAPTVSWLPGNNLEEQIEYVWSLPPEAIAQTLEDAATSIASITSDFDAMTFLQAFVSYSSSDKFWENAFGVVDAASVVPAAKIFNLTKSASKSMMKFGPKAEKIMNELGHADKAATEVVAKNPEVIAKGITKAEEVVPSLPSGMNVESLFEGSKNLSGSAYRKLVGNAQARANLITSAVEGGVQGIDTLSPVERSLLASDQFEDILKAHPSIKHGAADWDIVKAEDTKDNVDKLVVTFTKNNGKLFDSEKQATTWSNRYLQFKDSKVVQKGDKFAVEVTKPIVQGSDLRALGLEADQVTPEMSRPMRFLYSEGYKLSPTQVKDRRTVSDLSEYTGRLVENLAEPIRTLGKKEFSELEDTLDEISNLPKPKNGPKQWPTNPEFQNKFYSLHQKFPSTEQQDAYFAFRQIYDLDYMLRDHILMTKKMRLGIENWEIKGISQSFEGVFTRELPWDKDGFFRAVVLDEKGKVLKQVSTMSGKPTIAKFRKDFENRNYTIVQAASGSVKIGDKGPYATFVLTKTGKRSVIRPGQSVSYNPGGHKINVDPYYLKQAQLEHIPENGKNLYKGDTTLFNVTTRRQGENIAPLVNQAIELRKAGKTAEFNKFVRDNLPELTKKDWKRIGDTPVALTRAGERTIDTSFYRKGEDYSHEIFVNSYDLGNNLVGKFLSERDKVNVPALLSENNAITRVDRAKTVRPFQAMDIGINEAFSQKAFTEYTEKSVNTYLREFGDIIDASENEIRRNPIPFLTDPKFKEGVDQKNIDKAKSVASAINHFIGTPTESSRRLNSFKDHIRNWALEKGGKDSGLFRIVDERLLHTVKDPASYFRGVAFHYKMGLFNPKQLFLQSQIVTQVAAIGGVPEALKASAAFAYTYGMRMTAKPIMLKDAAKRLKKFGWKEDEFIESHQALLKSGWDIVGGSVAVRDWYEGPQLIKGKAGNALEVGTYFFKKGEQIGRITAWHTAYLNWKKANPGKALNREAIAAIRLRASDMTANMTRDMNAVWQRGIGSVPTQFWGFQARVMEQMISPRSRLTKVERARLFAGISLMYGVPVGFGAGLGVWPVNESVRKYILENGYKDTVENNPMIEALTDGILSTGLKMMTGVDLDTSPYGPAGNPFFKDVIRGDKNAYEIFGGASAGIIIDAISPLFKGLYDMISMETSTDSVFDVTTSNIISSLRNISSVNNVVRLAQALNTGKYITKNGTVVGDVTVAEAYINAITALDLQDFSDAFLQIESMADTKAMVSGAIKDATKEYGAARRALEENDKDAFKYHVERAKAIGIRSGLSSKELSVARERGFNTRDLTDSVAERFNEYVIDHNNKRKGNVE